MAAQGLSVFSITFSSSSTKQSCKKTFEQVLSFNVSNSFMGRRLSIQPSSFSLIASKRRSFAAISLNLPTTIAEGIDSDKKPKWSARAIRAFAMGRLEARKLKHAKVGTESLLLGILIEGTSMASKFLRENGFTITKVRDEIVKVLGKSDMYFFSPECPPLTGPAQRVIDSVYEEKLKSGENGEITVAHLLLGIWSQKECAGHVILANLGFNDDKAKELAKNMDRDITLSYK